MSDDVRKEFENKCSDFCRGQKLDVTKHHDQFYGFYLFDSTEENEIITTRLI